MTACAAYVNLAEGTCAMFGKINLHHSDKVLLSIGELNAVLGISDTTRLRLERTNPDFPKKVRVSPRRVAYRRSDVMRYIDSN
ncbi:helix-turn-helix transcriptional regulator [Seohaeicola zhoushanensis]|uniref:helix-turn-helix transcriptional regulator n=1 Tax=Seohaeicola zhoushanensis TaxID=1569283 RepID=UPI00357139F1